MSEKLCREIAGEISMSEKPGGTMRKWREVFGITQSELGNSLGISASTISDYEGNRRKSPGSNVIKRFVEALIDIDKDRGSPTISKLVGQETPVDQFFDVHEFASVISGLDLEKILSAKCVYGEELLKEKKLYGYTIMESLRVILEMPYSNFPKLYGTMSERAFIFTQVSTGRSPMVVIRVTPMKPSIVVLHDLEATKVDKLALQIAEKEQIPILVTKLDLERIREELKKL